MKHQMQPNRWSCSVTSAAMVLDIPVTELISQLGHDGGEIYYPHNTPPCCYRGFDISEIVDVVMRRGWAVTPIIAWPTSTPNGTDVHDVYPEFSLKDRMDWYLQRFDGIAYGERETKLEKRTHVIAWSKDERRWHDPSGPILQKDKPSIAIRTFWVFQKAEQYFADSFSRV